MKEGVPEEIFPNQEFLKFVKNTENSDFDVYEKALEIEFNYKNREELLEKLNKILDFLKKHRPGAATLLWDTIGHLENKN